VAVVLLEREVGCAALFSRARPASFDDRTLLCPRDAARREATTFRVVGCGGVFFIIKSKGKKKKSV